MKNLPVEIWRFILLDAISVPKLFSVDPIPPNGPPDEDEYWASERTRNALRRVCSSWNHFLSLYDSRYVRTSDVIHGTIPAAQLARARRIRADDCRLVRCKSLHYSPPRVIASLELVLNQANGQAPWPVEILDVERAGYLGFTTPKIKHLSNLRALYLWAGRIPDDFLSAAPPLSILAGTYCTPDTMSRMDLSKLTTLQLEIGPPASLNDICIPSLIHVALSTCWRYDSPQRIIDWLEVHGSTLETFYWIHQHEELEMTSFDVDDIWPLCPRLKRLQLPWMAEWTPPPVSHALQLLRLNEGLALYPLQPCPLCHQIHDFTVQFSDPLPQFLNSDICAVQLTFQRWSHTLTGVDAAMDGVFCLWMQAKSHAIAVVDDRGWTFEQAVVAHLERRKGVVM